MAAEWTHRTRVFLNWTQSDIIRLQELWFDLHCFFNLFVNALPRFWHKEFTDVAWQKSWKSRHRSCEVCLTLLNLSLGLKSSGNSKRALFRAFNHPRILIWDPRNTGFTVYQAWGWGGWENLRKFWVKMWLTPRCWLKSEVKRKFSRPTLRWLLATPYFRKRRKLHRVYFCKDSGIVATL